MIRTLVYSAVTGLVSASLGALVSTAAAGTARIALFAAATGILPVISGIVYDTRPVRALFRWAGWKDHLCSP